MKPAHVRRAFTSLSAALLGLAIWGLAAGAQAQSPRPMNLVRNAKPIEDAGADPTENQYSFLETLQLEKATPPNVVYERIKTFGQQRGGYLSLGESHLEGPTSHAVAYKLARLFTDRVKNKFILCSETIDEFLYSRQGLDLKKRSKEVRIFSGNNPAQTNFAECIFNSDSNALTYSGFFHQYRFAKAWPADFPKSPVIVEPGNNILDQIKDRKRLFVTQIELLWLQNLATRNLVVNAPLDTAIFRKRATDLIAKTELIKANMGLLYGNENQILKNKYGIYLDRDAVGIESLMPKDSWILVTNRGIDRPLSQLGFLEKLLQRSDVEIMTFLKRSKTVKPFFVGGHNGPNENGQHFTMIYRGLWFDGEGDLLDLNGKMILSDYGKDEFQCFEAHDSEEDMLAVPTPVSCDYFFN